MVWGLGLRFRAEHTKDAVARASFYVYCTGSTYKLGATERRCGISMPMYGKVSKALF